MALRLRRGTEAERVSVIFQEGELVYVTDTKDLYAGDGTTPGGIKVSNVGSPDELTQNLDLNGFSITGNGSITATSFVGDGSGLTNLPIGPGNIVEGSNYRINVVGNDSSTIVNSATNTVTGIFVGDGSNLTNLDLNQLDDVLILSPTNGEVLTYTDGVWINAPSTGNGVVEGGDYKINIAGTDSSRIIDISTNTITGDLVTGSIVPVAGEIRVTNSTSQSVIVNESFDAQSVFILKRNTDADLSELDLNSGAIFFAQLDSNQDLTYGRIQGRPSGIRINADSTTTFGESTGIIILDGGNVGVGTVTPATKLEIKNGSLRFNESRTIASITSPVIGEMTYNSLNNKLTFYDGVEWRELISSGTTIAVSDFPGPIVLAGTTEVEKTSFGQDSVDVTGTIIYNSTFDRFEFFQAGSWITFPNQELDETSDVRFKTVTAESFVGTGAGTPTLESATNLDLQAGNAVRVIGAPFRLANLTTTQRNALTPANGDLIYNTTANRIQGYQNGAWINIDDGTAA